MKNKLQKHFIKLKLVAALLITGLSIGYSQAPYSIIQGKVWIEDDNSVDGLMQSGERKLPGIIVKQYNSSGDLVGVAITDANGMYTLENYAGTGNYKLVFDFPRDGFGEDNFSSAVTIPNVGGDYSVNSRVEYDEEESLHTCDITVSSPATIDANMGLVRRENTLTYCGMHEQLLPWAIPTNVAVPKIPAWVALNSTGATLWAGTAVHNPYIRYENQSNMPDHVELATGAQAKIFRAHDNVQALTLNSSYELEDDLPAFDGVLDYGGLSGREISNKFSATNGQTGASLGAGVVNTNYRGGGNALFPVEMQAATTILGGGNLSTQVATIASAGVCMVYRFGSNPLPINLVSFQAVREKSDVRLNWVTSREENNTGFEVEHSTDGKEWRMIGFVDSKSQNGSSYSALVYNYTHTGASRGLNLYRLKQTDLDGKYEFSNIATVNLDGRTSVDLFPNPVDRSGLLNVTGLSGSASIEVYNMTGTKIYQLESQKSSEQIDMIRFASGIYQVIVRDLVSGEVTIQKVIK